MRWFGQEPRTRRPPWSTLSGFRLLADAGRRSVVHVSVASEDESVEVKVTGGPHHFVVSDADGDVTIDASVDGMILTAVVDGQSHRFAFAVDGRRVAIRARSVEASFEIRPSAEAALDTAAQTNAGDGSSILAPMPGLVADIMVAVGDDVSAGQTLAVLESMKLFTDLKAPAAGRVARIAAHPWRDGDGQCLDYLRRPDGIVDIIGERSCPDYGLKNSRWPTFNHPITSDGHGDGQHVVFQHDPQPATLAHRFPFRR